MGKIKTTKYNNINDYKSSLYEGLGFNFETIKEASTSIENKVLKKIGAFIASKRIEKGLTMRDLKKRSHVSLAVITDLENAKSMPRMEIIIRLAIALDININDVYKAMMINFKQGLESSYVATCTMKAELASSIAGFGYNKEQVNEIMNYIKYIDYKRNAEAHNPVKY